MAAERITYQSGSFRLGGFIHQPSGDGPFPAVVWNHGSERDPDSMPALGSLFASHGYVFFVPHRRGQGGNPGPYIMDQLRRAQDEGGPAARSRMLVVLHREHLNDQIAALDHLRTLSCVDSTTIAVMGCSFGGIQTVLAASQPLGLRAGVAFATAARAWSGNPDLREALVEAARQSTIPLFFIQAENDFDLDPSRVLSAAMQKAGKPHRLEIFPRFGTTQDDGHAFCAEGADIWSPDVLAFLDHPDKLARSGG